jgi:hypothetical protein
MVVGLEVEVLLMYGSIRERGINCWEMRVFWGRIRCRVGSGMRLARFVVREQRRSVSC